MGRGVCGTSENPLGMGSPSAAVLGLREKLEENLSSNLVCSTQHGQIKVCCPRALTTRSPTIKSFKGQKVTEEAICILGCANPEQRERATKDSA